MRSATLVAAILRNDPPAAVLFMAAPMQVLSHNLQQLHMIDLRPSLESAYNAIETCKCKQCNSGHVVYPGLRVSGCDSRFLYARSDQNL